MFRKTVSIDKHTNNGIQIATESYYFLGIVLYRRDVIVYLPR